MGLTYVLDHDRRVVRCRGRGVLRSRDLQDFACRLIADPSFEPDYNSLIDLRGVAEVAVNSSVLLEPALTTLFASGSRCALLAVGGAVYAMACAYAAFSDQLGQRARVFGQVHEAEAWLAEPGEAGQAPALAGQE
jgi:hypothetical protein